MHVLESIQDLLHDLCCFLLSESRASESQANSRNLLKEVSSLHLLLYDIEVLFVLK